MQNSKNTCEFRAVLKELDLLKGYECPVANEYNKGLLTQVQSLRATTEQQASEISALDNSILGLTARLSAARQAIQPARQLLSSAEADVASERRQSGAIERELARLRADLSESGAVRRQLTACRRAIANLEARRCRMRQRLDGESAPKEELAEQAAASAAEAAISAAGTAAAESNRKELDLQKLEQLRSALDKRLGERRQRLQVVTEEASAAQAECAGARSQLRVDRRELRKLRRQVGAVALDRLAGRDREIELLTCRAETALSRLQAARCEPLATTQKRTRRKLAQQRARLNEAGAEARRWRQAVALVRRQLMALARSNEAAKRELGDAHSVADQLGTQVAAQRAKFSNIQRQLERLRRPSSNSHRDQTAAASSDKEESAMLKKFQTALRRSERRLERLQRRSRPRVAARLQALTVEADQAEVTLKERRQLLSAAHQRLASLRRAGNEQAATSKSMEEAIERLTRGLQTEETRRAAEREKRAGQDLELNNLKSELTAQLDQLTQLSDWLNCPTQLRQMRATGAEWRRDIDRLRGEAARLGAEIREQQRDSELAQRAVARTARERRAVSEVRQRADAETERLQRSLATAREAGPADSDAADADLPDIETPAARRRRFARAASAQRKAQEELRRCQAWLRRMRRLRRQAEAIGSAGPTFETIKIDDSLETTGNDERSQADNGSGSREELLAVKEALAEQRRQLQENLASAVARLDASRRRREDLLAGIDSAAAEQTRLDESTT
uniref:Centrosomal protein of 70 kDa n=1 Tax=Macrostomum lignano TaxID=282301 RepID=A0A1I8IQU9_9PLAT